RNRGTLLDSLRVRFSLLDQQLLSVMEATAPSTRIDSAVAARGGLLKSIDEKSWRTARLIGAVPQVDRLLELRLSGASHRQMLDSRLAMARQIVQTRLEVGKTTANIEQEIAVERTAADRLKRYRDTGIQLTNIANFYQIGILGVIFSGVL